MAGSSSAPAGGADGQEEQEGERAALASEDLPEAAERLAPVVRRDPQWEGASHRLAYKVYTSWAAATPDPLQRLLAVVIDG